VGKRSHTEIRIAESRMDDSLRQILNMDEDRFLSGPDRDGTGLDIEDVFAKEFAGVIADWMSDAGAEDAEPGAFMAQAIADAEGRVDHGGFHVAEVPDPAWGVMAIMDGEVVGLYVGSDLVVREDCRGQGIGRALVAERYKRFGDLPTWNLDTPAYSNAGEAAHRSAFRLLRQEAEMAAAPAPAP
jgi:hypothetical protein